MRELGSHVVPQAENMMHAMNPDQEQDSLKPNLRETVFMLIYRERLSVECVTLSQ